MPRNRAAAATIRSALPRTVVVLGLVSLLNDAASEMITPLLPIFLTATLGAGPAIVGFVEGLAEATASVIKLVSGRLADRGVPAKGLVLGGYGISNACRPLIGLASGWLAVLLLRFLDRVGKGLRTAPRDAYIASAAHPDQRGRAFGFHRSMDHAGAVIGPLLAFALLASQVDLRNVFLVSALPGALVILLLVFGLPAQHAPLAAPPKRFRWSELHGRLRAMIVAAGLLALASVPEVFVVLWATEAGMAVTWVPLVWAAASLAKMAIAMPAGVLSDRVGRLPLLLGGWAAGDAGRDRAGRAFADRRPRRRARARYGLRPVSPHSRAARAAGSGAVRRALGAVRVCRGVRDGRRRNGTGRRGAGRTRGDTVTRFAVTRDRRQGAAGQRYFCPNARGASGCCRRRWRCVFCSRPTASAARRWRWSDWP